MFIMLGLSFIIFMAQLSVFVLLLHINFNNNRENYNKMKRNMKVCVTGACGKIAYSLYNSLCSGTIFGTEVQIELRLVDVSTKRDQLKILKEELDDCCYQNLGNIMIFDEKDQQKPFQDADLAIFLGGMPRKPGMDRQELFSINAGIFKSQGEYLEKAAKKTVKCLVIANPACTNCMVLSLNAPSIPRQNFTALTRLDYNRFIGQVSKLFDCKPAQLKNVILWGNHSRKQYCDVSKLQIEGLSSQFISIKIKELNLAKVQKTMYERGGFILEKSNGNAYISSTKAIIDHLRDWFLGSNNIISMGVVLESDKYGIPKGLCFSLPTRCIGGGEYKVVDYDLFQELQKRIGENRDELLKQRVLVEAYLPLDS